MEHSEFINSIFDTLDDKLFNELKSYLIKENYMTFYFIKEENILNEIFKEKLHDYFLKVELNKGKNFDELIEKYFDSLNDIVAGKIAKKQKQKQKKKGTEVISIPRARKYYDKAEVIKKQITYQNIIDYSRIMLCLYSAIINNEHKEIDNFNYASESLNIKKIINAMKAETNNIGKSLKFNINKPYDYDRIVFILTIILYYHIISKDIAED